MRFALTNCKILSAFGMSVLLYSKKRSNDILVLEIFLMILAHSAMLQQMLCFDDL